MVKVLCQPPNVQQQKPHSNHVPLTSQPSLMLLLQSAQSVAQEVMVQVGLLLIRVHAMLALGLLQLVEQLPQLVTVTRFACAQSAHVRQPHT
jgi:hypothetical protein